MTNQNKLIAAAVVLILLALGVWYFWYQKNSMPPTDNQNAALPANLQESAEVKQSLGGELYNKANNPLADKLPDLDPVAGANAILGFYKNPFE